MRKNKRGFKPTRINENIPMTDENTATPDAPVVDTAPAPEQAVPAADLAPLDSTPAADTTAAPEIIATDAVSAPAESETPALAIIETEAPVVAKEEQTITAADVGADVATGASGVTPDAVVVDPAPLAAADVTIAPIVQPTTDTATVTDVHPVTTHVNNLLDSYYEEMRPGYPTNADKGKFKQRHLESVYKQVLARTEGEFDIAMDALLAYVDKHRNGVFAEAYVFRFMAVTWPTAQNRAFFETFTALILRIHDPKSRGIVLRQSINYVNVLKKLLKPEEAERLQGFIEKYL